MHPNHTQETDMDTLTPVQPMATTRHEFARRSGLVALFAVATAAAYVGIRVQAPMLLAPVLCALGALFLPRSSTVRVVLLSIAAVGCLVLAAMVAFWLALLVVFSGAQFG